MTTVRSASARRALGILAASLLLVPLAAYVERAAAADPPVVADSLLGQFGEILKVYHLYSASDGRSYIEVMDVPPQRTPIGLVQYFDRQVRRVVIGYWKDGEFNDWHYAVNQNLLIYLQGTQVLTTGDGKEYRLEPGMVVLAEDWTGRGHTNRCHAPDKQRVCLLLQITIGDVDRSLPLRAPPASAASAVSTPPRGK
jgi:hypothetical protein